MSGPPPSAEDGTKVCMDCQLELPYGPRESAFYRVSRTSSKVGASAWQARCKACDKRNRNVQRGSLPRGVLALATHEEVAAALGITAVEVVRAEASALAKLRKGLDA